MKIFGYRFETLSHEFSLTIIANTLEEADKIAFADNMPIKVFQREEVIMTNSRILSSFISRK